MEREVRGGAKAPLYAARHPEQGLWAKFGKDGSFAGWKRKISDASAFVDETAVRAAWTKARGIESKFSESLPPAPAPGKLVLRAQAPVSDLGGKVPAWAVCDDRSFWLSRKKNGTLEMEPGHCQAQVYFDEAQARSQAQWAFKAGVSDGRPLGLVGFEVWLSGSWSPAAGGDFSCAAKSMAEKIQIDEAMAPSNGAAGGVRL